jgi:histidinol-phosphate/aromatic aminotransferase/cobyric acid decarboxylase-like protein
MKERINMETLGNPFGPSPLLNQQKEKILIREKAISVKKSRQLLKTSIAKWLKVSTEQIGVSRGSSEVIEIISHDFLRGQPVVMPIPTYFGLTNNLVSSGSEIISVSAGTQKKFVFDKELVNNLIKTSLRREAHVWLCNPNNPTGSYLELQLLKKLLTKLNQKLVIIDEAYLEFIDPENKNSAVQLVKQHPNLIVTKTLSKAYGLPDLRIGIVIANPQIVEHLESKVSGNSSINYLKASYAIKDQIYQKQFSNWVKKELTSFYFGLLAIDQIEASSLSISGVMLLRHKTEQLHQLLDEVGVKTRNMNNEKGIEGEGYVRIGLQNSLTNQKFIKKISSILL